MHTPQRSSEKSSPPLLREKSRKRAYMGDKTRALEMPEQTNKPTVLEKGCYYATTTRDVFTMNVYFIEVIEVYGSTIVYRLAPQPLLSPLQLKSAKAILQNVDPKVGEMNTSSLGSFFHTDTDAFCLSLMTKLT